MITKLHIIEALQEMAPATNFLDPGEIDRKLRALLREFGYEPMDVYSIGNAVVTMAIQTGAPPEETIIEAFVTGIILAHVLQRKGAVT